MTEPKDHAAKRGAFEEILRKIPGFRGYLEKEYRRDSDRLQRQHVAELLEKSKRSLDDMARPLVDARDLDLLPKFDRLRGRLDKLLARVKGAVGGYSGMFDLVKVDEAMLERVYEHDRSVGEAAARLNAEIERLEAEPMSMDERLNAIERTIEGVDKQWSERDRILSGLGDSK